MIGTRAKDHHLVRSTVALLGGTVLTVLAGIAVARMSYDTSWGFAIGYLGTFLVWPFVVLGLLHTRSSGEALCICGVGLAVFGGCALL